MNPPICSIGDIANSGFIRLPKPARSSAEAKVWLGRKADVPLVVAKEVC